MPGSPDDLLDSATRARIERGALAPYLRAQRWFGGKARGIASARFADWAQLTAAPHRSWLAIVEVTYDDGGRERYQITLSASGGAVVCDTVTDADACRAMLNAIVRAHTLAAYAGAIEGRPTDAEPGVDSTIEVVPLPGVHSNSAIALGGRYLMKLFRRIEPGINPDVEIGRFLAQHGAEVHVPKLIGTIEYRVGTDAPAVLTLVQQFVASRGNAWDRALAEIDAFFDAAQPQSAAAAKDAHRLARRSIDGMSLLGRRTAELHRAIAADVGDPAFAPAQSSPADIEMLLARVREQIVRALDLLEGRCDTFDSETEALARRVLARRTALIGRLDAIGRELRTFLQIRIHGDYHLGQVLCVDDDFMIIDFEGEPTRPLAERRAKQSPLRDVAGLLRSLSYAAHAGLRAAARDDRDRRAMLAPWADAWHAATADAFLEAYRPIAEAANLVPHDRARLQQTLDMFVLEKALYELEYELNNRPDWVTAPLSGILSLAGAAHA